MKERESGRERERERERERAGEKERERCTHLEWLVYHSPCLLSISLAQAVEEKTNNERKGKKRHYEVEE